MAQLRKRGLSLAAIALLGACNSTPTGPGGGGTQYIVLLTPSRAVLERGNSLRLKATVMDLEGKPVQAASLNWSSSDAQVASVADGGLVQGSAEGTAEIAASWHGSRGSSQISVVRPQAEQPNCPQLAVAAAEIPSEDAPPGSCPEL